MLPRTLEPEAMDTAEEAGDYDAMDHSEVNRRFVADLLGAAGEKIDRNASIVDVGTGTALIPIEFCRQSPGGRIVAIDLADEMLRVAERNVVRAGLQDRIRLQRVDAKGLPFRDGEFPVVMSNSIVHHIPEPSGVIGEMVRVTVRDGLLFVRDLLRPGTAEDVERIVALYAGRESSRQQQLFRQSLHAALTLVEVREISREYGIPAQNIQATSDRHWTLAWRKA
jgi:ubiquinone/menaquinone biosynthesis C-methylase UbiE